MNLVILPAHLIHPIVLTAVSTGLRRGEILGLRWRDADLDFLLLSVTRALYKRSGVLVFKEPKSKHSRRQVGMTPFLAVLLREYRVEREAHFAMLGYSLKEDDLIFCRYDGSPIDPDTLTHSFQKLVRAAGIVGVRFHDLRHTFASLMLRAGVNVKVISEMMGHSSVAFTLDTYAHVTSGQQQEAAKKLEEVLGHGFIAEASDVVKMLSTDQGLGVKDGASERDRTSDLRFTKSVWRLLKHLFW